MGIDTKHHKTLDHNIPGMANLRCSKQKQKKNGMFEAAT